jgi:hypothetical protein
MRATDIDQSRGAYRQWPEIEKEFESWMQPQLALTFRIAEGIAVNPKRKSAMATFMMH